MCTAINYLGNKHLFGRNLDVEVCYIEEVVITPRNFPLRYKRFPTQREHYAFIGMATVEQGYPLYYDAANEHGLCMAALNFVGNAVYPKAKKGENALASYELIPYLLSTCKTTKEAIPILRNLRLCDLPFNAYLPLSSLHFLLADKCQSLTIEQTQEGLQLYDNPVGVLTNNPPFPFHMQHLTLFENLTARERAKGWNFPSCETAHSRGLGGVGLPGDNSSPSRFIRAAFIKQNARALTGEAEISQFFHILGSVEQVEGCVQVQDKWERTQYTSCIDTQKKIYYYRTYENPSITAVRLTKAAAQGNELQRFPLSNSLLVHSEN